MYKDVCKRVWAFLLTVCLVMTMVEWPTTIWAATGGAANTYQNGNGTLEAQPYEAATVAAVFTVNQNAGGAELLDSIEFYAHVDESGQGATATVAYCMDLTGSAPDSGTFIFQKEMSVVEGKNTCNAELANQVMTYGSSFSIMITLSGASFYTYGGTAAGQSYVSDNGWQDMYSSGKCAAIRAYTYNVSQAASRSAASQNTTTQSNASVWSARSSSDPMSLNKSNMMMAVGWVDTDLTLLNATGTVKWISADESIVSVSGSGSTASVMGVALGSTTVTAECDGETFSCDVTVTPKIEADSITLAPENTVYNGSQQVPGVTVQVGENTLTYPQHYQIYYRQVTDAGTTVDLYPSTDLTAFVNAGTYYISVVGQNGYSGSYQKTYTIGTKEVSDASIEVKMLDNVDWNTVLTDGVADPSKLNDCFEYVRDNGRTDGVTDLTYGTDYTLAVGEDGMSIILSGIGNYSGNRYCGAPRSLTEAEIVFDKDEYVYTGKEWTPALHVVVDGVTLSASDYDVQYENNIEANDTKDMTARAKVTVTGKGGSFYDTKEAYFTIVPKDLGNEDKQQIGMEVSVKALAAGGDDAATAEPVITVTYNGMTLVKDTDYTIDADVTTGANGTWRRILRGIGNYKGTYTVEYSVGTALSKYITGITVDDATYDGTAKTPAYTINWVGGANTAGLAENVDYTVSYSNNINAGTATMTLQGIGTYGGSISVNFTIQQADMNNAVCSFLDENGNEVKTSGYQIEYSPDVADVKPEVVVKFAQGDKWVTMQEADYSLTYSVDTNLAVGPQTVTITPQNSNFTTATQTVTYNVGKSGLNNTKITATIDKEIFDYTGAEITPPTESLVYRSKSGNTYTLVKGTDYTVSYSADPVKEIGTYQVIITGTGNYEGAVTKDFEVTAVDIQTLVNGTNMKVVNPADQKVTGYDGPYWAMLWYDDADKSNNKLQIELTDDEGYTLVQGTDYELSDYTNIKEISKTGSVASVTITGKGKYYGSVDVKYLLAAKLNKEYSVSITNDTNPVYTGEPIELDQGDITVSNGGIFLWKEVLEQGIDYTVSYTDGDDPDAAVKAGEATATIEAIPLEDQPSANGCYVYEDSAQKLSGTFTISPKDIATEVSCELIKKPYEGSPVTFGEDEIKLTYRNQSMVAGTDFAMIPDSFENNDRPTSLAMVKVQGMGNYTGTKVIVFTITGKSLDDIVSWKVDSTQTTYTGEYLYPAITELTLSDGSVLTETSSPKISDIIIYDKSSYEGNLNAGTASITVSGKGEYAETADRVLEFAILPRDITGNCTVSGVKSGGYTYTSEAIAPSVSVQCTNPKKILGTSDYDISYEDNTDVGTASIVLTGKGNYTGTYTETFSIGEKNLADAEVVIAPIEAQSYEGIAVRPAPVVIYDFGAGTYTLSPETDYTVSYANNQGPGTATVTVTARTGGNFTGSKSLDFRIGQSITDENVFEINCPALTDGTTFVYNGNAYEPEVTVTRIDVSTPRKLEAGKDYTVTYDANTDAGTGTITVEGQGIYVGTWEREFTIAPRNLMDADVALAVGTDHVTDGTYKTPYTGSPVEPEVTLSYNGTEIDASDYTVSYAADHTSRGIVPLTVTANEDTNFTGSRGTTYEIGLASIGNGTYTPADGFRIGAIEPQPLVNGAATPQPQLYYNGMALTYGTDYVCTYENNDKTGSDAVVILTGRGNYTGSVKKKFTICGNIADAVITVPDEIWFKDYVTADETQIAFDEKNIEFDVKVVMDGVELAKDTDYTLTYADNTWVGNASVTITGIGSWAGSITKQVPIKADLSEPGISITVGDQKYTGNPVEAVPSITYYGTELASGKHFIIHTYENNTNIGTDTASVTVIGNEKNGFTGTLTESFSIVAAPGTLTVSGVESSYKYRGEQIRPQVTVKAGSKTLASTDYEVTYGPNKDAGTDGGSIVVKGKNSYAGIVEALTFDIEAQNMADLKVMDGNQTTFKSREYTGKEIVPQVTLTAAVGTTAYELPVTCYTVAKKDGADNTNVGTGVIVVTGDGTNVIGSREITFPIVAKSLAKPASGDTDTIFVELVPDTFAYDGTEKKPTAIVTYQYGTESEVRQLTEGMDYTVAYSNNINAGKAVATITGTGNYTNSRKVEYTITEKDFTGAAVNFPNGTEYPYMGNSTGVEPEVTVTLDGKTLTKGTDYTVEYQNNKACGTANVVVTGSGCYAGSVTKTFQIVSHDIAASDVTVAEIPNQAYTGQPVVPEVTVNCGDYKLKQGEDYTLTFDTDNTEIGSVLMRINGTGGFKNYRLATFNIASSIEEAEVVGIKDSYPFTGQTYSVDALGITEVRIGSTVLSADSYSFAFAEGSDGKSAGTQTLLLIGQGTYGGKKEMDLTITPKNISDEDVVMTGFEESVPYSDNITQKITFQWGDITLARDVDYTVICKPKETVGTYTMDVTGIGNYTGSITREFTIEQTSIDGIDVKGISSTYTYTGNPIEPQLEVWMGDEKLTENTDYTISFENNLNAGVAKVTITGTGTHYIGTKELSFNILRKSIHLCEIGDIPTQVYTGSDVKPAVTVSDDGNSLTIMQDYTLMYSNNRKAGTGVAAVAGKGNYTATRNLTFDIRPCNVGTAAVKGTSQNTVTLSWKSQGVVTGYEVYRAGANGKWQQVTRTRETTYTDQKLAAGTTYSYKVRTYLVADGETYYGEFSEVVTGTTSK